MIIVKDNRKIIIKHPFLKRIRNFLREVIFLETKKQLSIILRHNKPHRDWEYLDILRYESICLCYKCGKSDRDMIFLKDPGAKNGKGLWYCVECHESYQEKVAPEKFFNKGVVARPEAFKPCYQLAWCPYGNLVEAFRPVGDPRYTFCYVFHHQCPAFYVSELVCTDSISAPRPNPKLTETLRDIEWFNEKNVVNSIEGSMHSPEKWYYRPCEDLLWCPYGSLGDEFKPRKSNKKYACPVYPHDCPVFYHAESIEDDLDFWTRDEITRTEKIIDKEKFFTRNRKPKIRIDSNQSPKKGEKRVDFDFFTIQ